MGCGEQASSLCPGLSSVSSSKNRLREDRAVFKRVCAAGRRAVLGALILLVKIWGGSFPPTVTVYVVSSCNAMGLLGLRAVARAKV